MDNVQQSLLSPYKTDQQYPNHRPAELSETDGDGQQGMWVTGFWRRLPYLGIASLLAILLRK